MTGDVAISVIIPVFNGERTLRACLETVAASDHGSYEVIVVDDGSFDASMALASGFECRLVRLERNLGAAAARNRGAALARGDLLFFLDADIAIERDTLSQIEATFRRLPAISALFCSYRAATPAPGFFAAYKNLLHHHTHQIANPEAATFCGGYGAIKREVFVAIGGFNEEQRSLEDIDLGYRLHRDGYRIYLNKAIQLTHHKDYSLLGLMRSDVVHRAIPWTVLMLRNRIFRNDLNTRTNNVVSVPVAYLIALALLLTAVWPPGIVGVALLAGGLALLNRDFLRLARREKGPLFALQTALMCWLNCLYNGVGLVAGLLAFAGETWFAPGKAARPGYDRPERLP